MRPMSCHTKNVASKFYQTFLNLANGCPDWKKQNAFVLSIYFCLHNQILSLTYGINHLIAQGKYFSDINGGLLKRSNKTSF